MYSRVWFVLLFVYTALVCAEPAVDRVHTADGRFVLVPADYDRDAQCVTDYLCIGNVNAACNVDDLRAKEITHIISLIGSAECAQPDDIERIELRVWDVAYQPMDDAFRAANDVINRVRATPGGRVLVHCAAGVSRSSATVIYHLMSEHAMTYDDALDAVRLVRRVVQPNSGFERQLRAFEELPTRQKTEL